MRTKNKKNSTPNQSDL